MIFVLYTLSTMMCKPHWNHNIYHLKTPNCSGSLFLFDFVYWRPILRYSIPSICHGQYIMTINRLFDSTYFTTLLFFSTLSTYLKVPFLLKLQFTKGSDVGSGSLVGELPQVQWLIAYKQLQIPWCIYPNPKKYFNRWWLLLCQ